MICTTYNNDDETYCLNNDGEKSNDPKSNDPETNGLNNYDEKTKCPNKSDGETNGRTKSL